MRAPLAGRGAPRAGRTTPTPSAATVELAERLEFDLTEELGYRYPDFSDGPDPAAVQLARVCARAFDERYRHAQRPPTRADARLREELALIAELGLSGFFLLHWEVLELAREVAAEVRGPGSPRHLLPPGRGRGSSVGSIVCYLTGLSHVDPVAAGPLARPLPEPRARLGARHRPRLPAGHPRAADRRRLRALRPRARRARRELLHLPVARRDPRRRQGARPAAGGARAPCAPLRTAGTRRKRRRGAGAAARRRAPRAARRAGAPSASCAPRSPACRATSPSTRAAWSSRPARSSSSSRSSRPRWRGASSASGTRTRAPTRASSRSTCSGSACSRRSRSASTRSSRLRGDDDRPLAHPARRPGGLPGDPGRGHGRPLPDREPRADAEPPPHAAGEPRRPDRAGRARPAGADPGEGGPSVHRAAPAAAARIPTYEPPDDHPLLAEPLRETLGASSSRSRCSRSRSRSPASAWGRRRGCGAR